MLNPGMVRGLLGFVGFRVSGFVGFRVLDGFRWCQMASDGLRWREMV